MIPNTETTNLLIQAGALGVLLFVLYGGYRLAKTMLDRMFDQSDNTMQFVKEQIEKADAERKGNLRRCCSS